MTQEIPTNPQVAQALLHPTPRATVCIFSNTTLTTYLFSMK